MKSRSETLTMRLSVLCRGDTGKLRKCRMLLASLGSVAGTAVLAAAAGRLALLAGRVYTLGRSRCIHATGAIAGRDRRFGGR